MITAPDPIDIHVGNRLKFRRLWVGLSKAELGDHIGLCSQQIQKYENGRNRISASRLFQLSILLHVPIEYFFEGIFSSDTSPFPAMATLESSGFLNEILSGRDTLDLNLAFVEIKDKEMRRSVITLIQALGD